MKDQFTDEMNRICANLAQYYYSWLENERLRDKLPISMYWKDVGAHTYLYGQTEASPNATSLGLKSPETENQLNEYKTQKQDLKERAQGMNESLAQTISLYRVLGLPRLPPLPGKILRELDIAGELGTRLMVVGTNAFSAYELQAGERFMKGIDGTDDFDLSWRFNGHTVLAGASESGSPLMRALLKADKTFKLSNERSYQAINSEGYPVELLTAPSNHRTLPKDEVFNPIPFIEQEWLLLGKPVRHVVATMDNRPCPIVAPDPRFMALHKLWLSSKAERDPRKKPKDKMQGDLLLDVVRRKMQGSHPLDVEFVLSIPDDIMDVFNAWCTREGHIPGKEDYDMR